MLVLICIQEGLCPHVLQPFLLFSLWLLAKEKNINTHLQKFKEKTTPIFFFCSKDHLNLSCYFYRYTSQIKLFYALRTSHFQTLMTFLRQAFVVSMTLTCEINIVLKLTVHITVMPYAMHSGEIQSQRSGTQI